MKVVVWLSVTFLVILGLGNAAVTDLGVWTLYVAGAVAVVTSVVGLVAPDPPASAASVLPEPASNPAPAATSAGTAGHETFPTYTPPADAAAVPPESSDGRVSGSVLLGLIVGTLALCVLGVIGLFVGEDEMSEAEKLCWLLEADGVDCVP